MITRKERHDTSKFVVSFFNGAFEENYFMFCTSGMIEMKIDEC